MKKVLIKGAGEHSSATAHRLFRCGYDVVMTELASPLAVRRTVSFCSAIVHGAWTVEGVEAVRVDALGPPNGAIQVFVDPECAVLERWQPDVVIDARILKRNLDNSVDDAPLVIGFGPGLVAGRDVHYVIETMRGHNLGRIITRGSAQPNTGEPGPVGGYSLERVLRAPAEGVFRTQHAIGALVRAGEVVGEVDGATVVAEIAGVLRGLIFPDTWVRAGLKIGDIDPRGDRSFCDTMSDKARTLSGSALEVVVSWSRDAVRV